MATMAAYIKRTGTPMIAPAANGEWEQPIDSYRLRPLPSEDVYFFSKKIDNSRVVRESDPAARRKAWKAGAKGFAAAGLVIILLMPRALSMVAGYQIHLLARDHDRLVNERAALQLEEAKLQSPERLEQLARDLNLITPDPKRVVVLNPKSEGALAMNVTK